MSETLVQIVRTIERIPEYVTIDKDEEIKKQFEEAAERNAVVRAVLAGKTSFTAEYKKYFREFDLQSSDSRYQLLVRFKESAPDLESCIGPSYFEEHLSGGLNPAKGAIGGAIVGAMIPAFDYMLNKKINRRDLLIGAFAVSFCGGMGAMVGSIPLEINQNTAIMLGKNAEHLDEVYTRLYKHPNQTRAGIYMNRRELLTFFTHRA